MSRPQLKLSCDLVEGKRDQKLLQSDISQTEQRRDCEHERGMRGWKVRRSAVIQSARRRRTQPPLVLSSARFGSVLLTLSSHNDHRCHHPGVPPRRARAARSGISRHSSALEVNIQNTEVCQDRTPSYSSCSPLTNLQLSSDRLLSNQSTSLSPAPFLPQLSASSS